MLKNNQRSQPYACFLVQANVAIFFSIGSKPVHPMALTLARFLVIAIQAPAATIIEMILTAPSAAKTYSELYHALPGEKITYGGG